MTFDEIKAYFESINSEVIFIDATIQSSISPQDNICNTSDCNKIIIKKITTNEFYQQIYNIDDVFSFSGHVALKIDSISTKYTTFSNNENIDIEIFNEDNIFMGMLCFKETINNRSVNELTEWQKSALYTDLTLLSNNTPLNDISIHQVKNHYFVINEDLLDDYLLNYAKTAPLWGEFSHIKLVEKPYNKEISQIKAIRGLKYQTDDQSRNAIWSVNQVYTFERFLKMYHLLELVFYYDWVNDIKDLNDNLAGISNLVKDIHTIKDEIKQLHRVLSIRDIDYSEIIPFINKYKSYKHISNEIFFKFGKESNPIKAGKNEESFNCMVNDCNFSYEKYNSIFRKPNKDVSRDDHNTYILNLIVYWIYRVRCSIAHNKIGEFIITHEHEEFVCEFVEPLLRSIIIEILRSEKKA